MKADGANVILLWLVLPCVQPTFQSSCVEENSCESFTEKHYCNITDGATAGVHYKPVCPVIEVQQGIPKFNTIYLHCCEKENNITSRKWFFKQDHRNKTWKLLDLTQNRFSWKPLDVTNETIFVNKIRDHRMGFYKCITKHNNKITDKPTIRVQKIKCPLGYNKPEVNFPEDAYVKVGQHFKTSFLVNFGCEAKARNISIRFFRDSIQIKTQNVSHISIQGCASNRTTPRSCRGNISLQVTQADIGMAVSINVSACYGGKLQNVTRNFILNGHLIRKNASPNNKVVLIIGSVAALVIILILVILVRNKCHVWIRSRMSFPVRLIDRGKSKQVCILHCDDETRSANYVRDWITWEYPLLGVVCSCDLNGRGVLTGERGVIQESDYVIFIPSYSAADKVNENVFNSSIVQRKDYSRITILEPCASQTRKCSLSKNKIFKKLKHVKLKSCSVEDINRSGLRDRLPICAPRRKSNDIWTYLLSR